MPKRIRDAKIQNSRYDRQLKLDCEEPEQDLGSEESNERKESLRVYNKGVVLVKHLVSSYTDRCKKKE